MFNKFRMLLTLLPLILLLSLTGGCTSDRLHVEREGVIIDIGIRHMLQDKRFKSLEYDSKTGVIKIEKFASETSEVVSDIVNLITTLKP